MVEAHDLNQSSLRHRAVRAAQGKEPFDVLISDGLIVDMITGQTRAANIGLVGPLIASVHPQDQHVDARERVCARDHFVTPGLVDMHMHVESSMITPAAYANEVMPRGVTTIVWDPHEFGNTCAEGGVDYALENASNSLLRILTLAPSCVPSAPGYESTGGDFHPAVIESLLEKDDIHGVAEVMSMQAVLDRDPRFSRIVEAGLKSGKRVCGHARGLSGAQLNAYVTAGIETDHELISAVDFLEKLQAGLTIELRGSHDHLLPEIVEAINTLGFLPQTVTLCTDDVFIDDLVDKGGLDDVVRRLVGYGLDPVWALQAATNNAATRLGRRDLGLIAPGKRADIVIAESIDPFKASTVIANGRLIARHGAMLVEQTPRDVPELMRSTMKVKPLGANDFKIVANGSHADVVTIEKPRFTEWGERRVNVDSGFIVCPDDLTIMTIVNRFNDGAVPRVAFLGQWGNWKGAFATTVSHDSHNLTVFGGNEEDMAVAANAVQEQGGGLAVSSGGILLARLALPIAGLISEDTTAAIAEDFTNVRNAMDSVVSWQPPYLVFKACFGASLVCNAGPRLSDVGIVDTQNSTVLGSPVVN